ncbi:MAG: T9SS type A sorting domain-containing protein [Bacteroidia bacterium]|nr:T9SS type A sorting domain-containing protein [Bacteroidia bacterium]
MDYYIQKDTFSLSVNNYAYWNWWVCGIKVETSDKCTVDCNDLSYLGRAIEFKGHTINTKVLGNTMNTCMDGIVFVSNAGLGNQGSETQPSDNYWQNVGERHTYSYYSDMAQWTFFVRDNTGYVPLINYAPDTDPPSTAINYEFSDPDASHYCTGLPVPLLISYGLELKIAANELVYQVNPQQNKWFGKKYLYNKLKKEPEILSYDTIFSFAYDSLQQTPISKLYDYNEMVGDILTDSTLVLQLLQLNSNIVATNNLEDNHKFVNEIYLSSFAQGIDSIDPAQYSNLYELAMKCPYTEGDAVYGARVMLSIIDSTLVFFNDCEQFSQTGDKSLVSNIGETKSNKGKINPSFTFYPNPANDKLIIEIDGTIDSELFFMFYNVNNIEVLRKSCEGSFTKLIVSTKNINSGVYYCKVMDNKSILQTEKIVIIK